MSCGKGFTLYFISSDNAPRSYGCTPGVTKTVVGPITCTGPSNDHNAEWPAITTKGRPVAGPGVSARLLGTVFRKGVGTQVTYRGHPLYLFDQMPGQITGEGWFEPGLPPWYGTRGSSTPTASSSPPSTSGGRRRGSRQRAISASGIYARRYGSALLSHHDVMVAYGVIVLHGAQAAPPRGVDRLRRVMEKGRQRAPPASYERRNSTWAASRNGTTRYTARPK